MKKLEDMNLMDDFLVSSLMNSRKYGEKAVRYILGCILKRPLGKLTVVPQRVMCGESPEKHGIRLDVYIDEEGGEIIDIEPDQNDGKKDVQAVPQRARFYHAKINSANLDVGKSYSCLRNVVIIFITTYDPLGLDRMVYTVRKCCVEAPELSYDDGETTIYLYTKGTQGRPEEELKDLLRYMEDSTEENARTDSLKELHRMVRAVKSDGEVGISYMKSVEIEEKIREEGRKEGRKEGQEEGRKEGMAAGIDIMLQAIECAKTKGYTTADQLVQAGYDRKVAEAAIKCIGQ